MWAIWMLIRTRKPFCLGANLGIFTVAPPDTAPLLVKMTVAEMDIGRKINQKAVITNQLWGVGKTRVLAGQRLLRLLLKNSSFF